VDIESGDALDNDFHEMSPRSRGEDMPPRQEPRLRSNLKSGLKAPFPGSGQGSHARLCAGSRAPRQSRRLTKQPRQHSPRKAHAPAPDRPLRRDFTIPRVGRPTMATFAVGHAENAIAARPETYTLYVALFADVTAVMAQQARSALDRSEDLVKEALA